MIFNLIIPKLNEYMKSVRIEALYVALGEQLLSGSKVLDMSVDLSSVFAQNCPPISYHRVVLREKLWVRKLLIQTGSYCNPDDCIALLSSEPTEALDQAIARPARIMVAGIVYHPEMWSGSHA